MGERHAIVLPKAQRLVNETVYEAAKDALRKNRSDLPESYAACTAWRCCCCQKNYHQGSLFYQIIVSEGGINALVGVCYDCIHDAVLDIKNERWTLDYSSKPDLEATMKKVFDIVKKHGTGIRDGHEDEEKNLGGEEPRKINFREFL